MVIDNASTNGSPQEVAKAYPAVELIRNERNLGFSEANNKAIQISRGRHVLILNDDAVLQEGSLALMMRTIDSRPELGAVGPKLINPDGSPQIELTNKRFPSLLGVTCQLAHLEWLFRKWRWTRDMFTLARDPNLSGEAEHLAGACLLLRRKALEEVSPFDERFFYWYEDSDLCFRLKKAGWGIHYIPEAVVKHWGSSSFKKLMRSERAAMAFDSLLYYFKKHSSPAKWLLVRGVILGILLLRLPLAAALAASQPRRDRTDWKETMQQYFHIVSSLLGAVK